MICYWTIIKHLKLIVALTITGHIKRSAIKDIY